MKRLTLFVVILVSLTLACNLTRNTDDGLSTAEPNILPPIATAIPDSANPNPVQPPSDNPPSANPQPRTEIDPQVQNPNFFVFITSPSAGSRVNANGFTVTGQQRGSFENNVIVQARDSNGNVLQQVATTAIGELGEVGIWEVTLTVDASAIGSRGSIYAFYTSARDGSEQAHWQIEVTYQ